MSQDHDPIESDSEVESGKRYDWEDEYDRVKSYVGYLERSKADLTKELADASEQFQALQDNFEEQVKSSEDVQEALNEQVRKTKHLYEERLQKSRETTDDLMGQVKALSEEIADQKSSAQLEQDTIALENIELEQLLENSAHEIQGLKQKDRETEGRCAEQLELVKALQIKLAEKEEQFNTSRTELAEHDRQVKLLQTELVEQTRHNELLQTELVEQTRHNELSQIELAERTKLIKSLQTELAEQKRQVESLQGSLDDRAKSAKLVQETLSAQINTSEKELEDIRAKLRGLERLEVEYNEWVKELEKQLNETSNNGAERLQEVEDAREKARRIEQQRDGFAKKLEALEREIGESQATSTRLTDVIERQNEKGAEQERLISRLNTEVLTLNQQVQEAKRGQTRAEAKSESIASEVVSKATAFKSLQDQSASRDSEMMRLRDQLAAATKELEASHEMAEQHREKFQVDSQEVAHLREENRRLQDDLDNQTPTDQVGRLRLENAIAKQELQERAKQIASLEETQNKLERSHEGLQREKQALMAAEAARRSPQRHDESEEPDDDDLVHEDEQAVSRHDSSRHGDRYRRVRRFSSLGSSIIGRSSPYQQRDVLSGRDPLAPNVDSPSEIDSETEPVLPLRRKRQRISQSPVTNTRQRRQIDVPPQARPHGPIIISIEDLRNARYPEGFPLQNELQDLVTEWDRKLPRWPSLPPAAHCVSIRANRNDAKVKWTPSEKYACRTCERLGRICCAIHTTGMLTLKPVDRSGQYQPEEVKFWMQRSKQARDD